MPDADDVNTSGWDAINSPLESLYPGQEPLHWGTVISARLGGNDPLDGISAYRSNAGQPHWHFVSYGMSELYAKESDDPEYSGFGFEFTLRLVRDSEEPPSWALSFLQNLARYVWQTGNPFAIGHYMNLNGPIALDRADTALHAVLIAADPELPEIATPNGKLAFLQFVGVTLDELNAAMAWNTVGMLDVMEQHNPLLITDLDRTSILNDDDVSAEIARRTSEEGSSTGVFYNPTLNWRFPSPGAIHLTLGANGVRSVLPLLRGRLPFGRSLILAGEGQRALTLEPSNRTSWTVKGDKELTLALPAEVTRALADTIKPKRGSYAVPLAPELTVHVVPSEIKDASGKVVEVIGE